MNPTPPDTRTVLARYAPPSLESVSFDARTILVAFLDGRTQTTLLAYDRDLRDFARFLGAASSKRALEILLKLTQGHANAIALGFKADLFARGLKPATICRRLAALRSVVKMARSLGVINWTLDVPSPKSKAYRNTKGPGKEGWDKLLEKARLRAQRVNWRPQCHAKAVRDLAIIRLLHDLGLRRSEVVAIDMVDLDFEARTVDVLGKGRTDKEPLTLPDPTVRVLVAWLELRGREPGPLFVRLDRAADEAEGDGRLSDWSVWDLVRELGKKAGIERPVKPHGLRHEAITRALDKTKGDIRAVQKFSRHSNPQTVLIYDDNLRDLAGEVAALVAGD